MEKIDLGGNALSGQMVWNKLFDWKKKKEGRAPFFLWPFRGGCMPCVWQGQMRASRI